MAKRRIKRRRKKSKEKIQANSAHASLCALAPVITDKKIFVPIHEKVQIRQKEVIYRPADKLIWLFRVEWGNEKMLEYLTRAI
jgi:hypothetical protein